MYKVHKKVEQVQTAEGKYWNDVCMRLPIVKVDIDGSVAEKTEKQKVDENRISKRSVGEKEDDESWDDFFGDFSMDDEDELERKAKYTKLCF
jgi:hypothetical protein